MTKLRFANNDFMPSLGLGTWKSAPDKVHKAVIEALSVGYRHIDCAPIYGNEPAIGNALRESFRNNVVSRHEVWITSKLWNNAHHPEDVQPALERTLADLQLDYLDLYLVHWPVHVVKDVLFPSSADHYIPYEKLPISETWKAMEDMVAKGLCKHIGVSNFSVKKLRDLVEKSRLKPELNQIEIHPYLQQKVMLNYCQQNRIHLTAYSPLGSGDRPTELRAEDEPVLLHDPVIARIAKRSGITEALVLLSWAINRGTAVIPKSADPKRIEQNMKTQHVLLTLEDMQTINELDRNRRYVTGKFWTGGGSPYTLANLWDELQ